MGLTGKSRILIVRLGAIGDVIRTLPALRALRCALPSAYIAWAVEDRAASLLLHHPDLDQVFVLPRKKWQRAWFTGETLQEVNAFLHTLRAQKFDLVLDFHGLLKSGLITRLSGGKERVGFARRFCKEGNFLFTTRHVSLPPHKINRVEKNLALVRALGISVDNHDPIIPITAEDCRYVENLLGAHPRSTKGPRIILHPGSSPSTPYKRWDLQRYAHLADLLIQRHQARIFFTAAKDEWDLITQVTGPMKSTDFQLSPTDTLTQLAELIRRCDLYIGNDTAPMHLAAFVGTPVVALFGPTDPIENAPYGNADIIMLRKTLECNPCRNRDCSPPRCMDALSVTEVADAAERILRKRADNPARRTNCS
jgi:lipopolysaccharide heptosyltransferase I